MDKNGKKMSDERRKKASVEQSNKVETMYDDFFTLAHSRIGTQEQFEKFISLGDIVYEKDWFWIRHYTGKHEHYKIYKAIKNILDEIAKDKGDMVHLSKPGIRKLLNDNLATMVNVNQKNPLFKQSPDIINIQFLRDVAKFATGVHLGGSKSTRTPLSTAELDHIEKRLELQEILKNSDGLANVVGNLEEFIGEGFK